MLENRKGCALGIRRCDPKNLTEIVHCLYHHGRHSFGEMAESLHVRRDALSRRTAPYGESEDTSVSLTVGELITGTNLQDDRRAVEEVCRRTGGVFVRMPDAHTADTDVYDALTAAVEELGQDSGVIRKILSDGVIESDEADRAEREIDETIAALVRLKSTVRRKVARPSILSTARKLS